MLCVCFCSVTCFRHVVMLHKEPYHITSATYLNTVRLVASCSSVCWNIIETEMLLKSSLDGSSYLGYCVFNSCVQTDTQTLTRDKRLSLCVAWEHCIFLQQEKELVKCIFVGLNLKHFLKKGLTYSLDLILPLISLCCASTSFFYFKPFMLYSAVY